MTDERPAAYLLQTVVDRHRTHGVSADERDRLAALGLVWDEQPVDWPVDNDPGDTPPGASVEP